MTARSLAVLAVLAGWSVVSPVRGTAEGSPARAITFEDRVRAQEAIERVYYSHQIGASLPFEEAVPRAVLEEKVRTYLKLSLALEAYWNTPVTAEALEAELKRISRETQMAGRLRALFAALGDDVVLIQECIVRPALVQRLARSFFAHDETIHGAARSEAEAIRAALLSGHLATDEDHPRRSVVSYSLRHRSPVFRSENPPETDVPSAGQLPELSPEEYARVRASLPETGDVGPLDQESGAYSVQVVLEEEDTAFWVARWSTPKAGWDEWWASTQGALDELSVTVVASPGVELPVPAVAAESGGIAGPPEPAYAPCAPDDTWITSSILDDYLEPRSSHTAVWTGSLMIVWGGLSAASASGSGALYDPATDTWSPVSKTNAPSPRWGHTAVWTGSLMLVWGGANGVGAVNNTGARYDPITDMWTPMAAASFLLEQRYAHTAVWAETEMLIWGGGTFSGVGWKSGARYDPASDTWRRMSPNGPSHRLQHTAVWTGSQMIVWGGTLDGTSFPNTGSRYDPAADSWFPMSIVGAPSGRWGHTAVWTGSVMVIWGGIFTESPSKPPARYDPITNSWSPVSLTDAPQANFFEGVWTGSRMLVWSEFGGGGSYDPTLNRWSAISSVNRPRPTNSFTAIWTGSLMIVWGGSDFGDVNTGGRYHATTNSWTPTANPNLGPEPRFAHTAVWTGSLMMIWGGAPREFSALSTGGRYDPVMDVWSHISNKNAPTARAGHTAVWTGRHLVVWGGTAASTGGRYDPVWDEWLPTSTINAPSPRSGHSAVWTGRWMIIWGGSGTSGGRYDPVSDHWTPTSLLSAPSGRSYHAAVWTGREMIVWGGQPNFSLRLNTGGRYNPVTDTWGLLSTSGAPTGRSGHSATWTGREMIVWGGAFVEPSWTHLNSGGRFDPDTDTWTATSTVNAPAPREDHTAIWTGRHMIVWGGRNLSVALDTGGRYDPQLNGWLATSRSEAPRARLGHDAVWTGSLMMVWGGSLFTQSIGDGGLYAMGLADDDDGDGVSECGGDCNDANEAVYPGAPQICDGGDNDCASSSWPATPEAEIDTDRDGFRPCESDCNDADPNVRPGATEICNDVDDDCDGSIDEDPAGADADEDGAGDMCDNCLLTPNSGQEDDVHPNGVGDACDDPDGDGLFDDADNCPGIANVAQGDGDADGSGDECDVCPTAYNPDQREAVACLALTEDGGQCLEAGLFIREEVGEGMVRVLAEQILMPDQITVELMASSCVRYDQMEVFLNGVSLGYITDSELTCTCNPPIRTLTISDPTLLRSLWRLDGNNTFQLTKPGTGSYLEGTFVVWVRARMHASSLVQTECLYDFIGSGCTATLCDGYFTEEPISAEKTLEDPLSGEVEQAASPLSGAALPGLLDISMMPDDPARICVEVEADPALYAATDRGDLLTLDPDTAVPMAVKPLPFGATEIEFDDRGKRAFMSDYNSTLREIDIATGNTVGSPIYTDWPTEALEFVGGTLYASRVTYPEADLRILSPLTGQAIWLGATGKRWITGLAYDGRTRTMYGSAYSSGAPSILVTVNLRTGKAADVGSMGIPATSLEFGPDGVLYAGSGAGRLYRIDPATGQSTLVGSTGYPFPSFQYMIAGLTRVAPLRIDCVPFVKQGESLIAINGAGCGPPVALAGADISTECTSPAGATVVLDGSGSTEPESSPGTNDGIIEFEWIEDLGLPTETLLGTGELLEVALPLGSHRVALRVTDRFGATDADETIAEIVDSVAPMVTAAADPPVLWPPNHRMVPVSVAVTAEDLCDPDPDVSLASVSSSEPDDLPGNGDGHTTGDIQVLTSSSAAVEVLLRAERGGAGTGRLYTITLSAVDGSGNAAEAMSAALVPHDQSGSTEPIELEFSEPDGPGGTVALTWTAVPGAASYNVLRGSLADVSAAGSFTVIEGGYCVGRAVTSAALSNDGLQDEPASGEGFFYVVESFDGRNHSGYGTAAGGGEVVVTSGDSCH